MNTVNIETPSSSHKINTDSTTTVEDVIIEVCKICKIGPLARHLFALRINSSKIWLSLNTKVEGIKEKDFEFNIRFNVPDVNRLKEIDVNAYNFYFNQVKYAILRNKIPDINCRDFKSKIIGMGVVDMYRAMVEDGREKEDVIRDYRRFIPQEIYKLHSFFVKKPMVKKLNMMIEMAANMDTFYIKSGYLDQFKTIVPHYLTEEFKAFITCTERQSGVLIRVNPFHSQFPGVSMKYEHNDEWEHVCSIDDLCFLNVREEGTVEISRKNGIPINLQFHSIPDMMSFVSLLDGYYRLSVKWSFNLFRDLPTPSLQKLLLWKCHGPISGEFAYRKLEEKRNNKAGCFILRESDLEYDTYYIDVCTKTSAKPVTHKIETTNNKQYRLCNSLTTYPSLSALIQAHKSEEENDIVLQECLPPSEFDQSNLLICRVENTKKESTTTKPLIIDTRSLMVFKNRPQDGRSPFTTVYRAVWTVDKEKRNVAMKILNEKFMEKKLSEFLSLVARWAFVNSNAVVKFYGSTPFSPLSMVMEYLPLGQLDHYLQNVDRHSPVEEVDLVEASAYLANALWYLEEAGFVHGNIRCRKLLVSSHSDNSFVVKLSDPGLQDEYTDMDIHWIPPEFYDDLKEARNSVDADVYAFGTTVWEIFSYGKSPPLAEGNVIKKFYNSGKNLPQPAGCPSNVYHLIMECWFRERDYRKKPQAVMRDINLILYQVYNARKGHSYHTIVPTHDNQQDNVSNKSKESDDISSSLFSELTLTTFVDDGDERGSSDSCNANNDIISNIYRGGKSSPQVYQRIPYSNSVMSSISQPDYNCMNDTAIASMQSIFELDREWNLVLTGRIGEGFHGEVYQATLHHWHNEEESQRVAVKKLKTNLVTRDRLADFDREISIMKKLDHPNIVRIKGIVRDPELCLVLEYIDHGSLRCYLNIHRERLRTHHLLKFALDVAKGMAYLAEQKIVHRDLASRNILVVNEFNVKISDFGLAQFIGNSNYYQFQTERDLPVEWYAPESLEFGKFSLQSDVWSYGVTLYEMFSYGADPRLPIPQQTVEDRLKAFKNGIRLECPRDCPRLVYLDIMRECWQYAVKERPTFRQLVKTIEDLFKPADDS